MEFVPKQGFVSAQLVQRKPDGKQIITEILTDHPGSSASQVVAHAKGSLGKNKVYELLAEGPWEHRQQGRSMLYSVSKSGVDIQEPTIEEIG
jgi:hypothetical protein